MRAQDLPGLFCFIRDQARVATKGISIKSAASIIIPSNDPADQLHQIRTRARFSTTKTQARARSLSIFGGNTAAAGGNRVPGERARLSGFRHGPVLLRLVV